MSRMAISSSLFLLMLLVPQSAGSAQSASDVWTSLGPHGMPVTALAIDRSNPKTIYVGADYRGVLKSTNGGASWTVLKLDTPYAGMEARAITIDPLNPNTIYAGAFDRVYKSTDAGANWLRIMMPRPGLIETIAIDPSNSNVIYAASRRMSSKARTAAQVGPQRTMG